MSNAYYICNKCEVIHMSGPYCPNCGNIMELDCEPWREQPSAHESRDDETKDE